MSKRTDRKMKKLFSMGHACGLSQDHEQVALGMEVFSG